MPTTTASRSKVALAERAQEEVEALLVEQLPSQVYFHNESHLEQVVKAAKALAEEAELSADEAEMLQMAAVFQSLAYLENGKNSWKKSTKAATEFLLRNNVPMDGVEKLLQVLNPKHEPETALEKLFLDAMSSYYGEKNFLERVDRLRKEEEALSKEELNEIDWLGDLLEDMKSHVFQTSHAESLFGKRKEKKHQEAHEKPQICHESAAGGGQKLQHQRQQRRPHHVQDGPAQPH